MYHSQFISKNKEDKEKGWEEESWDRRRKRRLTIRRIETESE